MIKIKKSFFFLCVDSFRILKNISDEFFTIGADLSFSHRFYFFFLPMKKLESLRKYQSEKTIVDAVLKISNIIKKITRTNQPSKQSISDGDLTHYNQDSQVPIPPPMRTIESYASSFSKQYAISSSNCNRAPIFLWKSHPYGSLSYSNR